MFIVLTLYSLVFPRVIDISFTEHVGVELMLLVVESVVT